MVHFSVECLVYSNSSLLLAGGRILIWDVMHFCVCVCISVVVLLCMIKVWKDRVYYCRIDEIDVLI